MGAVETLRQDHACVRRVITAVRGEIADARAGSPCLDADSLSRRLHFFHSYCSSCHELKEEEILFRALQRRGMAWSDPPLRDLLQDHAELDIILASAEDWLPLTRAGDRIARESILHDLELYLEVLDVHLTREEETLFPVTAQRLTGGDRAVVEAAFSAVAQDEIDDGVQGLYEDLARELTGPPRSDTPLS